jgi:DNA-binding response OmpR family regulator
MKLTNQEQRILNFLIGKTEVAWEELAQFSKDPSSVKMKTLQKAVSDLRKKFTDSNIPVPFKCKFITLLKKEPVVQEQKFVKMRTTPAGNLVSADSNEPNAYVDFKLEPNYRRIRTKNGVVNLGPAEWELFEFLYKNVEKPVSVEDMKNLVFKNFGSKTPHNWADSISRTLTKLRKNIPELKTQNRLLTVTGGATTSYMLK